MENYQFKFLSGIVNEASANQLVSNTKVFFGDPREKKSKRVTSFPVTFSPSVPESTLTVIAKTHTDRPDYVTTLQFENVRYVNEGTKHAVKIMAADGTPYYIMPLRYRQDDVKVTCTCLDFFYRFAVWNHANGSLLGDPPPPYQKTTDRPPVNPSKVPGVCKHVIRTLDFLRQNKILK